jgi:hypothetical protein
VLGFSLDAVPARVLGTEPAGAADEPVSAERRAVVQDEPAPVDGRDLVM